MQKYHTSLSLKRLRQVLDYDRCTGLFSWKVNLRRRALPKKIHPRKDGYVQIGIDGTVYKAHRLAWLYTYGEWPSAQIDHANGDTADNRIANLRLANAQLNTANSKCRITNQSGYKGASLHKTSGLYMARIMVNGTTILLGYFRTPQVANAAYAAAAKRHFGEFARAG